MFPGLPRVVAPAFFSICWSSGESKMIVAAAARRRSTASSDSTNDVGNHRDAREPSAEPAGLSPPSGFKQAVRDFRAGSTHLYPATNQLGSSSLAHSMARDASSSRSPCR